MAYRLRALIRQFSESDAYTALARPCILDGTVDDREIARRAMRFEREARDYRMFDLPGYRAWSERKLEEGVSGTLLAHLDAMGMILLPEELAEVSEDDFEEMLAELEAELG